MLTCGYQDLQIHHFPKQKAFQLKRTTQDNLAVFCSAFQFSTETLSFSLCLLYFLSLSPILYSSSVFIFFKNCTDV